MRVAITGHRPDVFIQSHYSQEQINLVAEGVVATFKRQYKDDLVFNVGGAIGADQIMGRACMEQQVPFHLYLPMTIEVQGRYWSQAQRQELHSQYEAAAGVHIIDPSGDYSVKNYFLRNRKMVDEADIVVAFWVGKRAGGTFDAIKYGLKSSKFVLNALNELKPIFNDDVKSGWTPPTVKGE